MVRIRLLGWGNPMKLVKTHGNAELAKGSKKPKESKRAKDAQQKDNRSLYVRKKPVAIPSH